VTIAEALARPLLAGVFVYGGIDTLRRPASKVPVAEPILEPLSKASGLSPQQLVSINAGVQVVAGVALAVGILPRPAAAVLAASLVPTTLGGHRFWEHDDEDAKRGHIVQLLKNVATLGGLVLAATSTGGRPSLPWRARRAAAHLVGSAGDTIEHLRPAALSS
jgi:putative oxidoreductase